MADVSAPAPVADRLVDELLGTLSPLVDGVLRERDIAAETERLRLNADALREDVLAGADALLLPTNPEIAAIRNSRAALASHQRAPRRPAWAPPYLATRLTLALWCGLLGPLAVWRTAPPFADALGTMLMLALETVACIAAVVLLVQLVPRPRVTPLPATRPSGGTSGEDQAPLFSSPAAIFGFAVAAVTVDSTWVVLFWRLRHPLSDAIGGFGALVWVVAAVPALLVTFALALAFDEMRLRFTPVRPAMVTVTWSFAASAFAGVAAYGVAFPDEPPDVPGLAGCLGTAVVLSLVAPPAVRSFRRLWSNSSLSTSPSWSQVHADLADRARSAEKAWRTAAEDQVRTAARRRIQELVRPPFSTTLTVHDVSGLRYLRAADLTVPTRAFARFSSRIDGMTGGALGIAGPRGSGKTTLLEYYQEGRRLDRPGTEHLAVFLTVPVRFEAREFALHLYARLCEEVTRFGEPTEAPAVVRNRGRRTWSSRLLWGLALAAAWATVGYTLQTVGSWPGPGSTPGDWRRAVGWPVLAVAAALSLTMAWTARTRGDRPMIDPAVRVTDLPSLRAHAAQKLDLIRFQQRWTAGWSGKIAVPFGAETSRTVGLEYARQPMAYPDLVNDIQVFLRTTVRILRTLPTAADIPVAVILDELDKIAGPDRAHEFLNEIKALFAADVPGCLFLVSVSENALTSFERRGMPLRDVVDSTFDDVLPVEYLSLADTRALVRGRVIGMPEPFPCLSHCLSGGLPRDLIRQLRLLVERRGDKLGDVTAALLAEELRRTSAALRNVVSGAFEAEPWASDLLRHIEAHARPEAQLLTDACRRPPLRLDPSVNDEALLGLEKLQLESLGYFYFCSTLLEVFTNACTEDDLSRGEASSGDGSFDTLASVRQLFSVNARLAWLTTSAFRKAWNLKEIPSPYAR